MPTVCVCMLRLISCVWLFFDPIDHSPPGSSVHRIFQARILEWVAISYSRGLPDPGIEPTSPALAGGFFATEPPRKPHMPPRMVQIKTTDRSKCWHEQGTTETIIHNWWECKILYPLWKTVSCKVKYILATWPNNSNPRFLPKRNENIVTQRLGSKCL